MAVNAESSWMFDLVAPDDILRGCALARLKSSNAAKSEALHWSNSVWARAGTPAPTEPHLSAEMDQARAEYRWHNERTISGQALKLLEHDNRTREAHAPFALLFLRWEADYPNEWCSPGTHMWSPWGLKEVILRDLAYRGVPPGVRGQATDLVVAAVRRPYRCKDWMYGQLVRHISDEEFLRRIDALLSVGGHLVSTRARFILHIAQHPERTVKRVTWQRWLDSTGLL
ncbi:hypothetical protein [Allokutzneria oryzae]|uniref:Uncharacterized protein n=1 Tax=Allokutzneria oryzae TaxID=1378989 RepID=A0ABV5ZXR0_9PSEU